MKTTIYLVLILICCSCGRRDNKEIPENFVIQEYSVSLDTSILNTVFHKDHFYCLKENNSIVCLTKNFFVDSIITNSINGLMFEFMFEEGDTLFAGLYENDTNYKVYYLDDGFKWKKPLLTRYPKPFYEDNKFVVSECCFGEFGGAIYFTDKRTKIIYGCPSSCPIFINLIKDNYYVTNSLAHMGGHTSILKIEDPTKLSKVNPDSLKKCCNCLSNEIGAKKIVDTIGLMTTASFTRNNQLYYLLTGYNQSGEGETLLSKVQEDKLVILKKISDKCRWTRNPRINKYGNMLLHSFSNRESSGFVTIKNDTISFVNIEKSHR